MRLLAENKRNGWVRFCGIAMTNVQEDEFATMINQMKKDGVTFEVCDYALKVMDVNPATVLPNVDHFGNGFISIAVYQAQGYYVVTVN